MPTHSTIAAIATAVGGGIGIVRVSGPAAEEIGRQVCAPWPDAPTSHHLYFGTVRVQAGEQIDSVFFTLMRGPKTYTGEDVLEIHGHGGQINMQRLLQAVLHAGAVQAGPGEFTKRAFLAGKLDLTRAEAVASLIGAQSIRAARMAQRQLAGELGRVVSELRRGVVVLLGEVEGALDFPDLDPDRAADNAMLREFDRLHGGISRLVRSYSGGGRVVQRGAEVALLGRPNVGKSSLVNALCQEERVLVDAEPGTTRDYVEVRTRWDDIHITLIDTAGEREADSGVERNGLRLGRERWQKADVVLLVVDGTCGMTAEDQEILRTIPPAQARLVAWNKIDRAGCQEPPAHGAPVGCSALCGWGVAEVRARVLEAIAPELDGEDEVLIINERQSALLKESADALGRARDQLTSGPVWDLVAAELRSATARMGEITGEEVTASVIDVVFSRFCIGK